MTEAFYYFFFLKNGTNRTEVILYIFTNPFILFGFSGDIINYSFSYLI